MTADPTTLAVKYVDLDELQPDPRNPKLHADEIIRESMGRFGYIDPIVRDDRTGLILSGHGRRDALAILRDGGDKPPIGVKVKAGRWMVPVTTGWSSVSDEEAGAAIVALNRTVEAGGWNDAALEQLLLSLGGDLAGTGYDNDDMDELREKLDRLDPADQSDDEIPDVPETPKTSLGDLWTVGPHRILCGDSSDIAALDRLIDGAKVGCVLTDPPYGMNLDTDYSKMPSGNDRSAINQQQKTYRPVAGDDQAFDASLLRTYLSRTKEQFWFGADYYRSSLSEDDRDGSWLVWDKRKEDGSQDDVIGSGFELLWTAVPHQRRMLRHYWCGAFGAPEARDRFHPTQKPIALLYEILDRWAPSGCVVADPFGGSGSHLVAAARTGRIGYGMELDPGYVDVIVARLEQETGLTAVRNP
jgi:DNA modification methylase